MDDSTTSPGFLPPPPPPSPVMMARLNLLLVCGCSSSFCCCMILFAALAPSMTECGLALCCLPPPGFLGEDAAEVGAVWLPLLLLRCDGFSLGDREEALPPPPEE